MATQKESQPRLEKSSRAEDPIPQEGNESTQPRLTGGDGDLAVVKRLLKTEIGLTAQSNGDLTALYYAATNGAS